MKTNVDLKVFNHLKNSARKEGVRNKILFDLPDNFEAGQIAEIALAAILGRLQEYGTDTRQYLYIESTKEIDEKGYDFCINGKYLQIKSQFLFNKRNYLNCTLIMDAPGIDNVKLVLAYLNISFMMNDFELISDVNYLWDSYMRIYKIYDLRDRILERENKEV